MCPSRKKPYEALIGTMLETHAGWWEEVGLVVERHNSDSESGEPNSLVQEWTVRRSSRERHGHESRQDSVPVMM